MDLPALLNGNQRHVQKLAMHGIHTVEQLVAVTKKDPRGWYKTGIGAVTATAVDEALRAAGLSDDPAAPVTPSPEEAQVWGVVSRALREGRLLIGVTEGQRRCVYAALGSMGGRDEVQKKLRWTNPPPELSSQFVVAYRKAVAAGVAA